LIITVPTIAAALWQGNMGTFLSYTAFNSAASPGPQGQPAGSYSAPAKNSETSRSSENLGTLNNGGASTGYSQPPVQQNPGSRGLASQSSNDRLSS
ncbi:Type IV secretion system protein virB6, partial [Xanthomonas nasturtii]